MKVNVKSNGIVHAGPFTVKWGNIHKPSEYEGKITHFGVDCVVTPEEGLELTNHLGDVWSSSVDWYLENRAKTPKEKAKVKKLSVSDMLRDEVDKEGEETGNQTLRFKKRIDEDRPVMESKPLCVESDGKTPYNGIIGREDKVVCSFRVGPWVTGIGSGVSLKLIGVQLIEKAAGGAGSDTFDAWESDDPDIDDYASEEADEETQETPF